MTQKLDAILACRLRGTRLYGKPLQLLDIEKGVTVLEYCASYLRSVKSVDRICLAISDEPENTAFIEVAERNGWPYVLGHPQDVLGRLIKAGDHIGATNVLRVTSECPFVASTEIDSAFQNHIQKGADYTSIESLPEGAGFEIISLAALKKSHLKGNERNRSELVTSYIFEHQDEFKIYRPEPPAAAKRSEVRVTIDYPEDLIFCRKIYRDLGGRERLIPINEIIAYWDKYPETRALVEAIGIDWGTGRLWK